MAPAERARRMAAEPYALRLDMSAALAHAGPLTWTETGAGPAGETGTIAANPAAWGDVILARKETPTSYHLAVVVDDAAQGVTEVVRGRDLFHSTSVHRLLQALLGLPAPRYHHHRLILDADGNKLSKSTPATGLRELRAQGVTAAGHPQGRRARLSAASVALSTSGRGTNGEAEAQQAARSSRAKRARAHARRRASARSKPRSPASRTTSARR